MSEIKTYEVWFHDGHVMFTIRALNNQDARRQANRCISIKCVNKVEEKQ